MKSIELLKVMFIFRLDYVIRHSESSNHNLISLARSPCCVHVRVCIWAFWISEFIWILKRHVPQFSISVLYFYHLSRLLCVYNSNTKEGYKHRYEVTITTYKTVILMPIQSVIQIIYLHIVDLMLYVARFQVVM